MHQLTDSRGMWPVFFLVTLAPLVAAPGENGATRFGAGIRLGANATGWFQDVGGRDRSSDVSRPLMIGPAVEFRITNLFAIEGGAFYQGVERSANGGYGALSSFSQQENGSVWHFPVSLKFRLPTGSRQLHPFVVAGPSFYRLRTTEHAEGSCLGAGPDGQPATQHYDTTSKIRESGLGFVAGGGVEWRARPARLTLEGRLNLWSDKRFNMGGVPGSCSLRCTQVPQLLVLVGAGF